MELPSAQNTESTQSTQSTQVHTATKASTSASRTNFTSTFVRNKVQKSIDLLRDELNNNTITKTLAEREIDNIQFLCSKIQSYDLRKTSLQEIKNMFEKYYQEKTYKAGDEASFDKLNPIVTSICSNIDNIVQETNQIMQNDNINVELLNKNQVKLTEIYNFIMEIISANDDITTNDLLLRLHDAIEKINNTKTSINLLIEKDVISMQLRELGDDNELNAKYLTELIGSPENFDVFEQFSSLYDQVMVKYLTSIDAAPENFDYELEMDKLRVANNINKENLKKELEEKNAVKKLTILQDNIIDLADKLEKMKI